MALIWRKTIDAMPISSISSDRICRLRVKSPLPGAADITIIGVYLPCADSGLKFYSEHLIELERVISEHQQHGPVVIMVDFNAHLCTMGGVRGTMGGVRGVGGPN